MVARRSDSDLSKANRLYNGTIHYDSETGQVYSEAVVSAKADTAKVARLLPRLKHVREGCRAHGAPTLERLAIQSVLDNVYDLQPETLVNVPWPVKKRIWNARNELSVRDVTN